MSQPNQHPKFYLFVRPYFLRKWAEQKKIFGLSSGTLVQQSFFVLLIFFRVFAVYRMVDRVNKGYTLKTGRPRVSAPTPINSNLAQLCYSWIENDFVAINAEDCPVGRQYSKAIGLFRTRDVYEKYIKSFELTSEHSAGQLPLSLKRFQTILKYHFDKNRVCIRKKKNVTGKCESTYHDIKCIGHVSYFVV